MRQPNNRKNPLLYLEHRFKCMLLKILKSRAYKSMFIAPLLKFLAISTLG